MRFSVKDKKFTLTAPITAIQGEFEKDDIADSQHLLINWNPFFEQYFQNPTLLFHLLDISLENKDPLSLIKSPFLEKWAIFNQIKDNLEKLNGDFHLINGFLDLTQEQKQIQAKIATLHREIQNIEVMKQNSVLASKQDLLKKLLNDQESFKKKLEFQQDEFRVNENRMQQYTQHMTQLTTELDSLKQEQRQLYKETNILTTQLDEITQQTETYEEKLTEYQSKKLAEDEARVSEKLKPLKEKSIGLKEERGNKMQMSKAIQQRILILQNEIKQITINQMQFQPEYDRLHQTFTELKNAADIANKKINNVQGELEKELQTSPKSASVIDVIHQSTKSKDQILQEIQEQSVRLTTITDKLAHIKAKYRLSESELNQEGVIFNQQIDEIQKTLDQFTKPTAFQSEIAKKIGDIQLIYQYVNQFMKVISAEVSFTLDIDQDQRTISILQSIFYKGKLVKSEEDLKRTEKAYYVLSLIVAYFMVQKQPLIPLIFEYLPNYVTTKQTFLSACKMLKDTLETVFVQNSPMVVVLIPNQTIEFEPSFFIESKTEK